MSNENDQKVNTSGVTEVNVNNSPPNNAVELVKENTGANKRTIVWNSDKLNVIRDYLREGKSVAWIAHELGTNVNNLKQRLHKEGIKVRALRDGNSGTQSKLERRNKELSIAERLAVLQGLTQAPEGERVFSFTDAQLTSWITSPELFFSELLGIKLYDYQKEMLSMLQKHRRAVFCCGRGVGKTYLNALWLLYTAIIKPSQKCLVIAPSDRQARILLEYVHGFIANNDALFRSVDFRKTNAEKVTFTNGSWVSPLGSTSFLRGYQNIDLLVLDEAAYLENAEKLWSALLPMLRSEKGRFVVASTPNVVGDKFHQAFLNPSFQRLQIPTTMCPRFTVVELEQMAQDLSPHEYATEVLAEFVEGSDNFFSPELIARCTERYDFASSPASKEGLFAGLDVGRYKDASVFVVVQRGEGDVLRVVFAKEILNTLLPQQTHIVKQLCDAWGVQQLVAESNGLSIHMVEELQNLGVPVEAFQPTLQSKQEAFTHLLREMEGGRVVLPFVPRLQHQLRNFRYEVTSRGQLKLHHSTELVGDDWCDALCFAVWASKSRGAAWFFAEW